MSMSFAIKDDLQSLKHDLTFKIYQAQIAGAVLIIGVLKLIM